MKNRIKFKPPQPTKSLVQFDILIGKWDMVGTHPVFSSKAHGYSSFEWLVKETLLVWRFNWKQPGPPSAVSIIGHDDTSKICSMLYSDERGVARIYQMSLENGIWKMWRESSGFSQRMIGKFSNDKKTIAVKGELSRDNSNWEKDLDVTYVKRK